MQGKCVPSFLLAVSWCSTIQVVTCHLADALNIQNSSVFLVEGLNCVYGVCVCVSEEIGQDLSAA